MIKHREYERFYRLARPIITHPMFESQRDFVHHDRITVYDHVIMVAYHSYRLAEKLSLDVETIIKGALLHDFFLYDWHIEGKKINKRGVKRHGFTHAKIAFLNAITHFNLDAVESDIILKHMFPLNIKPPVYFESWLVYMVDNVVTFMDYFKRRTTVKDDLLVYLEKHKNRPTL